MVPHSILSFISSFWEIFSLPFTLQEHLAPWYHVLFEPDRDVKQRAIPNRNKAMVPCSHDASNPGNIDHNLSTLGVEQSRKSGLSEQQRGNDSSLTDDTLNPALLCAYCRGINIDSLFSCSAVADEGYTFHTHWKDVEECACPLCTFLSLPGSVSVQQADGILFPMGRFNDADRLSEETKARIKRFRPGMLYVVEEFGGKGLMAITDEQEALLGYWSLSIGEGGEKISEKYGIPIRRSLISTGSEASLETARQWLRTCDADHCCFPAASIPRRCPASRLIDVQAFDMPCQDVRLVETSHAADTGKYLALSYRWGPGHPALITTLSNLSSHHAGIPFATLPLTFQHAVHVARTLAVRYIWIDALCIVQDWPRDWDDQAGRMSAVYALATLVLSADCAADPTEGLFNARSTPFDEGGWGAHAALAAAAASLYLSTNTAFPAQFDHGLMAYEEDDPDRGLVTRAWTLQEAVLAPRVLHFTSVQLVWECAGRGYVGEGGFSVSLMDQRPTMVEVKERLRVRAGAHTKRGQDGSDDCGTVEDDGENGSDGGEVKEGEEGEGPVVQATREELDVLNAWYFDLILLRYSTRHLTYESDRLPAIAGLAAWTAETLRCEYVAGMWRTGLEWALTWRKESPGRTQGKPGPRDTAAPDTTAGAETPEKTALIPHNTKAGTRRCHAPSFSWASATGQIQWDHAISTFVPTLSISDLKVQLAGSSPFGRIHAGLDSGTWLRAEGWVARSMILRRQGGTRAWEMPGNVKCLVWLDSLDSEWDYDSDEEMTVALLELGVAAGPPDQTGFAERWVREGGRRNVCFLVLEEAGVVGEEGLFVRKGMGELNWSPQVMEEFRKGLRWETIALF